MGNQQSGDGSNNTRTGGRFMRTTGLLGLSKSELDERCKPSGLYPSCNWEDKAIKKLIGDGKLAARLRGTENRQSPTDRECPICFLQYKEVNTTKCCSAYICTECYLQVRPQKVKSSSGHSCPFCNHHKFSVTVAKEMNAEAMLAREETEQRFIEAKIRERKERKEMEDARDVAAAAEASEQQQQAAAFGQSLQNQLRARSSSISDQDEAMNIPQSVLRESFMSPEERRMLEDEMRAQHSHPLSLRLEAEAQERRLHNEQEFLRQNPTHALEAQVQAARAAARSSRRGRGSERRNWNQIVEAFERGGHGEVNSLDDLVVLEAAMILSMEEESRRRTDGGGGSGEGFDASRHASDGFPLVRNLLSGGASSTTDEQLQMLRNSLRGRTRNSLMRAYGGDAGGVAAMPMAGFGMGGMSEDDQVAMAIAASLQDQQQQQQQTEGEQQPSEGETQQQQQSEGEPASSDDTTNTAAAASTSEEQQAAAEENSAAAAAAPVVEADDTAANNDVDDDEAEFHAAAEETFETANEEDVEFETPTAEAPSESAGVVDVDEIETAAAQSTSEEPAAAATAESTAEGGGSVPDSLDVTNHGEEA